MQHMSRLQCVQTVVVAQLASLAVSTQPMRRVWHVEKLKQIDTACAVSCRLRENKYHKAEDMVMPRSKNRPNSAVHYAEGGELFDETVDNDFIETWKAAKAGTGCGGDELKAVDMGFLRTSW